MEGEDEKLDFPVVGWSSSPRAPNVVLSECGWLSAALRKEVPDVVGVIGEVPMGSSAGFAGDAVCEGKGCDCEERL